MSSMCSVGSSFPSRRPLKERIFVCPISSNCDPTAFVTGFRGVPDVGVTAGARGGASTEGARGSDNLPASADAGVWVVSDSEELSSTETLR